MKSAHRDIALWRFDSAIRSLWGLHMRARGPDARQTLADKLATVAPGDAHHLHFGAAIATDDLGHGQTACVPLSDVTFLRAPSLPATADARSIALDEDAWLGLIELLGSIEPGAESSVEVQTVGGHQPLWLWWDP